jgi:hypothetical protein
VLVSYVPGINEPSDETTIWQYMDFTKLVSMLDRGELFFVRIDKVDDPKEGTVPEFNLRERMPTYRAKYPDRTEEQHQKSFDDIDNYVDELIRQGKVLINCWHMNEFESAAMWDLYAKSGIAIKTTFEMLKDSLDKGTPELIKFGLVEYTDFKNEWMAEDNLYHRFFLKRKSFEHEKELRAVLQLELEGPTVMVRDGKRYVEDVRDTSNPKQKTERGRYVTADIHTLISEIYVAPSAASWVGDSVRAVLAKYGLKSEQVIVSELYSRK